MGRKGNNSERQKNFTFSNFFYFFFFYVLSYMMNLISKLIIIFVKFRNGSQFLKGNNSKCQKNVTCFIYLFIIFCSLQRCVVQIQPFYLFAVLITEYLSCCTLVYTPAGQVTLHCTLPPQLRQYLHNFDCLARRWRERRWRVSNGIEKQVFG